MTTSALIRIPLLKPETLDPLPVGTGYYVAVLQSKPGEREALAHVSAKTWERLTPLVEMVGPKNPKPILSKESVSAWGHNLHRCLGAHPFYFDILRLTATHPVEAKSGTDPVLGRLYAEARTRGMKFVPVAHVGQSAPAHVQHVADAALQDGNGVALRYRFLKVVPTAGKQHHDVLQDQLDVLGVDSADADLLLDLEFLDKDNEIDPDDIVFALQDMCKVGDWRSIVMVATSIPKMLGGPDGVKQGTVGTIRRREWDLWCEVRKREPPRMPAFGDYAIQNPEPPAEDIRGNTMRANIRYTTVEETIVARGQGPVSQEGSEQYHDLCKLIAARTEFSGASYSWGDTVIDECASGTREPGSQPTWRGAGTSHHLQFVTDQVRALEP